MSNRWMVDELEKRVGCSAVLILLLKGTTALSWAGCRLFVFGRRNTRMKREGRVDSRHERFHYFCYGRKVVNVAYEIECEDILIFI